MPGPYTNIFGPREAADVKGVVDRPAFAPTESNTDYWIKDCDPGDPESGTKLEAGFLNFFIANLRRAIRGLGVTQDAADDDLLLKCFQKVQSVVNVNNNAYGQINECYLKKDGSNLRLIREKGFRLLFPNNELVPIPIAGATLAATGLTPGTFYYIYGYKNSTEVALEAATTAPTVDADTGIKHKTGDESRVLVGAAVPVTGPAWSDANGAMFVLSYFNRKRKITRTRTTTARTIPSSLTTFSLVNAELTNQFIAWADEDTAAALAFTGLSEGGPSYVGIAWDGTGTPDIASGFYNTQNQNDAGFGSSFASGAVASERKAGQLTEAAAHYATVTGRSTNGTSSLGSTGSGGGTTHSTPAAVQTELRLEVMG